MQVCSLTSTIAVIGLWGERPRLLDFSLIFWCFLHSLLMILLDLCWVLCSIMDNSCKTCKICNSQDGNFPTLYFPDFSCLWWIYSKFRNKFTNWAIFFCCSALTPFLLVFLSNSNISITVLGSNADYCKSSQVGFGARISTSLGYTA